MKPIYYILLLGIFLFTPHISSGQVYSYLLNSKTDNNKHVSEYIIIKISDNWFEINNTTYYSNQGDAQGLTENISLGFTIRHNDTVILYDVKGGYSMKAVISDTTLRFIKGFEWFKSTVFSGSNNKYEFHKNYYKFYVRLFDDIVYRNTSIEGNLFSKTIDRDSIDTQPFNFSEGQYITVESIGVDNSYYHLTFKGNHYLYKYGKQLLTKGEWRQFSNYILLKDHTLETYFTLRITNKNYIITEVFPFTNRPLKFILSKE